jgi:hypothetical protein
LGQKGNASWTWRLRLFGRIKILEILVWKIIYFNSTSTSLRKIIQYYSANEKGFDNDSSGICWGLKSTSARPYHAYIIAIRKQYKCYTSK